MATPIERLTAIVQGMLDAVPSANQLTKVADAYVTLASAEEIQAKFNKTKVQLTNSERARVAVESMHRETRYRLREAGEVQGRLDAEAAIAAAAEAGWNAL